MNQKVATAIGWLGLLRLLAHMLALEIQQVCEDEIHFMREAPELYQ